MRKVVFIAAGVLVVLFLVIEFGIGMISDGAFPLTVDVVSVDPPNRLSAQVHAHHDDAVWASEQSHLYDDFRQVVTADPYNGQPFEVRVECSYHASPLGRQTDWTQANYLVVLAEWDDGRRVSKVVEIPDGRTTRTMSVELP